MPTGVESIQGPRLSFVLRKLEGTVQRTKYAPPPSKDAREADPKLRSMTENTEIEVEEDAGYMLFLPSGHAYRLTHEEVLRRGYLREPELIGFEQANSQDTPMGRYKLARTEAGKAKAWAEMEMQVISACVGKSGIPNLISDYNPNGLAKVEELTE